MTKSDYFRKHGASWGEFLKTEAGRDLIVYLNGTRPNLVPHPQEHLIVESAGAVRGYEQCIKNMILLLAPESKPQQPEQSYGIAKPEEPPAFISEADKARIRSELASKPQPISTN